MASKSNASKGGPQPGGGYIIDDSELDPPTPAEMRKIVADAESKPPEKITKKPSREA